MLTDSNLSPSLGCLSSFWHSQTLSTLPKYHQARKEKCEITTSLAQRQKWNAKLVWSRRTPSAWILVHQITTHVIKKQSWWSSLKLQTVSVAFECLYAAVTGVLKVAHDINEKQTAVWIYGSCYFSPMFLTVMNTKGRKLWQTALTHPLC